MGMEAWETALAEIAGSKLYYEGDLDIDEGGAYIRRCALEPELLIRLTRAASRLVVVDPPGGNVDFLEPVAGFVTALVTSGLNPEANRFVASFPRLQELAAHGDVPPDAEIASRELTSFAGDGSDAWRRMLMPVASLREVHLVGAEWAWFEEQSGFFSSVVMLDQRGRRSVPLLESLRGLRSLVVAGGAELDVSALGDMRDLTHLELGRLRSVVGLGSVGLGRLEMLILESVRSVDVPDILTREFPEDVCARPKSPFSPEVRDSPVARSRDWSIGPVAKR